MHKWDGGICSYRDLTEGAWSRCGRGLAPDETEYISVIWVTAT